MRMCLDTPNASCVFVFFSLPQGVLFLEEPQIARWDATKNYWRTDGFANFVYDEGMYWLKKKQQQEQQQTYIFGKTKKINIMLMECQK